MIERLTISLRALALLSDAELASAGSERMRADCADALRLELDCPQQSLNAPQRGALTRLSHSLESHSPSAEMADAVRGAAWALGLARATDTLPLSRSRE